MLSSLIRISAGHRIFAPYRSFSQLITSFFGAMYQGILRMLFVAWSFFSSFSIFRFLWVCLYYPTKNSTTLTRLISLHLYSSKTLQNCSYFNFRINLNKLIWIAFCTLIFLSLLCSCQSSLTDKSRNFLDLHSSPDLTVWWAQMNFCKSFNLA